MPTCKITLTSNAGVLLEIEGLKILCDGLHRHKTVNFSTLTPLLQTQMMQNPSFREIDALFFSHKHPDHYSHHLICAAKKLLADAIIISPVCEFRNQILLCEKNHHISINNVHLEFFKLTHDGKEFFNTPNYGCFIDNGRFTVLMLGDCAVADPQINKQLAGRRVDLALLNFPWLTLKRGRDFTEQYIKPRRVMYYHIPFAEDDISGFRNACASCIPLLQQPQNAALLLEAFQTEIIM